MSLFCVLYREIANEKAGFNLAFLDFLATEIKAADHSPKLLTACAQLQP